MGLWARLTLQRSFDAWKKPSRQISGALPDVPITPAKVVGKEQENLGPTSPIAGISPVKVLHLLEVCAIIT